MVYLTTQEKKPLPTHVKINSSKYPSTVLCEQIDTVNKDKVGDYIGQCSMAEMKKIDAALAVSIGIGINIKSNDLVKKWAEAANEAVKPDEKEPESIAEKVEMPKLDEFEAKITAKTKAVIINNPNNPTGVVYDEATIKAMAAILEKKEKEFGTSIVLISDEPYRELAYGGVEVPFVTKYYHNAVVGYSYSKSLSVPGERIGYVVIPDEVDDSAALIGAATIANRVIGCVNAPSLIQKVIKYCIEHEVTVDLETYEKNRNLIYGALTEYGFTCAKPDGAFYLFVKSPVENEKEFCEVAKKHHVLVVPGSSFACPGYVRLAYCVSYEQIERSLPAFKKIAEEYGLCK